MDRRWTIALVLAGSALAIGQAQPVGERIRSSRPAELRADKLPSARVLATLPAGSDLRLLSLEGGWAWVEAGTRSGWVRAGTLQLQPGTATAATLASGREAAGNTAVVLSVRSLPPRSNRHALIISIASYADPMTPALPGARIDRESATQIAQAMQVPAGNVRYLQDAQATGDAIRQALQDLEQRVQDGDRVFIHYAGHGTRFKDPGGGGCTEALLAHDGGWKGTLTHQEVARLLQPIARKTDKLFVMFDACHSGGLVDKRAVASRGFGNRNDEGRLRGRFSVTSQECTRPSNVRSRSLVEEATRAGALPQDIVHLSAARSDEISFEDELKGGLATQYVRDCLLRDADDIDQSGAISIEEVQRCAQAKIDRRMRGDTNFSAHHLTLSGNRAFVPAWFSQTTPVKAEANVVPAPPAAPPKAPSKPAAGAPTQPPTYAAAPVSTGAQALRQIFDQRDAKRRVELTLASRQLQIGRDTLGLTVQSDRAGYVYVALAGSDNQALHLLFPNELDADNRIAAGQRLVLPRASWPVVAQGPAGDNHLLVLVTDGPRDLTGLTKDPGSPFVSSLNDAQGRARLGILMTSSRLADQPACLAAASRSAQPGCSDAYGAAMEAVREVP